MDEVKEIVNIQVVNAPVDQVLPEDDIEGEICPVCADPRVDDINEYYVGRRCHSGKTAIHFKLPVSWIKNHAGHIDTEKVRAGIAWTPQDLRSRVRSRSDVLWGMVDRAANAGDLETAARLAETARRYDEMILKLAEAPGFKPKPAQGAPIKAPNSQILIVQGESGQSQPAQLLPPQAPK